MGGGKEGVEGGWSLEGTGGGGWGGGDIRVSRTHQTLVVIMGRLHDLAITSLVLCSEKIVLFM